MLNIIKRLTNRRGHTENSSISTNINSVPEDCQETNEPTTPLQEETLDTSWGNELAGKLESAIRGDYPRIDNLKIQLQPSQDYHGNGKYGKVLYVNITWNNGMSELRVKPIYDKVLSECCPTHDFKQAFSIRPFIRRIYSDDVILQASIKYANCISQNLPINIENIHYYKVGDVTIYDLVLSELRSLDEV